MKARGGYLLAKRVLDIICAFFGLVLLSPILFSVAFILWLAQGRPILFSQVRAGRYGAPFKLHKFRTMAPSVPYSSQSAASDHITGIGRFMRKTSLDELPQLWNVLRGDMSMVGPRPLLLEYLELYDHRQRRRHDLLPGLTGLAQARGRNLLDWEERLELDVQYVESVSLRTDTKILFLSMSAVLLARGITPENLDLMEKFKGKPPGGEEQ